MFFITPADSILVILFILSKFFPGFLKEEILKKRAKALRKTKTAFIRDALDEKLGLAKGRERVIRDTAGWLSHKDAQELREGLPFSA